MTIEIDNKFVEYNHDLLLEDKNKKRNKFTYDNKSISVTNRMQFYCSKCGKTVNTIFRYYNDSFVTLCKNCKKESTMIKNYGVKSNFSREKVLNKIKQTNLKRYGVENPFQSEEIKEKIKQTNLKKYGHVHAMNNDNIKNKCKATQFKNNNGKFAFNSKKQELTMIKKYDVKHALQNKEVCQKQKEIMISKYGNKNNFNKIKKTNLKRYGVENQFNRNSIKQRIAKQKKINFFKYLKKRNENIVPLFNIEEYTNVSLSYKWQCNKCNTKFKDNIDDGHIPRCPTCFPKYKSKPEKEITEWIKSLNISNIIENDRSILSGKELDIYLPDYNLAIEFNGLYWHSELNGKDRNYHFNKTIECEKQGIQLLHIFEDEWIDKQNIIKNIIKVKLGLIDKKISANECTIKEIDNQEDFLNVNHVQGYIPAEINIGLYHEEELVGLLTFSKFRYNEDYDWEILRCVDRLDTHVVGGFAKILKYFTNKYKGSIIAYSDRRLCSVNIYENNGFMKLKFTRPRCYYLNNNNYFIRYNRQQFQKHKLDTFDPSLTEWQNMQLNGWDRIWDVGNNIFIYKGELYV